MRHIVVKSSSAFPDEFYMNLYKDSVVEIEHFKQIYGPDNKRWRWFLDAKTPLMDPKYANPIGKLFALAAEKMGADYVATMGYGSAALIGTITANSKNLKGLIIRSSQKKYGNERDIIGDVADGKKIVVVDDLINSGGSILKMINILRQEGGITVGALSVFEFENSRGRGTLDNENVQLVSLAKLKTNPQSLPSVADIDVVDEEQQPS